MSFKKFENKEQAFIVRSAQIIARIRNVLNDKNISFKELAKLIDKDEHYVLKMLSFDNDLDLRMIVKLETILEVPLILIPEDKIIS